MKHFYQSVLLAKEVYTAVIRILAIIKANIPLDVFIIKVEPLLRTQLSI